MTPRVCALALVLAATLTSGMSNAAPKSETELPDSDKTIECRIRPTSSTAQDGGGFSVEAIVLNHGTDTVYVLTEDSAGALWIESTGRRIIVTHYAYTWERQEALWGGWTAKERYRPKFHKVAGGQSAILVWKVSQGISSGRWTVEGEIAIHTSVDGLETLEGPELERAMVDRDVVVSCETAVLSVR